MVNPPDSYDRDWPYFINPLPAAASTKESWSDAESYLRTAISDKSTRSDLVVGISDIVKAVWYDPSNNHPTLAYEHGDQFPIYLHCLECENHGNASYTESDIADRGWTFCNNYESASSMRKHSGWSLTPDADEIGIYVLMPDLQTQNKTSACAIEVHANAMKVMSRPFLMWDKPLEGDERRLFTPDYPKGKNIKTGSSAMRECGMVVFPTFDWPPSNNGVAGCLAWDEPQAFLDYEWKREEDSDDNPVYKTVGFDAVVHSLDNLQPRWKEDFERHIGSAEYNDLTLHCKYCEASKGYLVDDGQTLNDDAVAENGWNTCRSLNNNPKWWIQPSSTFKNPPINGSELSMTAPSLTGNGLEAADSDIVTLGLCSFELKLALWDNTTEQSTFLQPVMGRPFLLWDHPREDGTRKAFSPDHPRGRNMNSSEMQIQEEADPQAFAGYVKGGSLNAGNKFGSGSKLGAGAIAAVVLGAVIGVALIAGLIFLLMRRRRQHSKPKRSSPTVDSQVGRKCTEKHLTP